MSYLKNNVLDHQESVKIEPKINPIILLPKWIWGILGCWLLFIPTIQAISTTIRVKTTEYLITNTRVLEKYGLIATHTDEMPLSKVENVVVQYSFWGKIFNYGTIVFQGTNRNNVTFSYVKDAEAIKKAIHEII